MHSHQIEMLSLDDLISADHTYRKFHKLWNFSFTEKKLKQIEKGK